MQYSAAIYVLNLLAMGVDPNVVLQQLSSAIREEKIGYLYWAWMTNIQAITYNINTRKDDLKTFSRQAKLPACGLEHEALATIVALVTG